MLEFQTRFLLKGHNRNKIQTQKVSQYLSQPLPLEPITHECKRTAHIPALGM